MTAQAAAVLKTVLAGDPVPANWVDGCPVDVVLFTELVTGTRTMPADLLKLVPKALKDTNAGMGVLHHLNSRVGAISETATECKKKSSELSCRRQCWSTRGTCWLRWLLSGRS